MPRKKEPVVKAPARRMYQDLPAGQLVTFPAADGGVHKINLYHDGTVRGWVVHDDGVTEKDPGPISVYRFWYDNRGIMSNGRYHENDLRKLGAVIEHGKIRQDPLAQTEQAPSTPWEM